MQPDRQQPPPSTTVLAHSCSPCASHSTAASAHVAAELSIQVRGAKVLCDGDGALPSEGSLLQIEWQLWLRSQQRTTPNAAPAERCRVSFDKPRRELHAGTTRRAPNIELQPRPSFQDKSRAGGRGGRRPRWQAAAVRQRGVASGTVRRLTRRSSLHKRSSLRGRTKVRMLYVGRLHNGTRPEVRHMRDARLEAGRLQRMRHASLRTNLPTVASVGTYR